MDTIVKEAALFVALIAESFAILIILLGVIKTLAHYLKYPITLEFKSEMFLDLRKQLGSYLSLSLEFLIGADVLKTAISPTWNEIGMLGSIVLIRTFLNYFLTMELKTDLEKQINDKP